MPRPIFISLLTVEYNKDSQSICSAAERVWINNKTVFSRSRLTSDAGAHHHLLSRSYHVPHVSRILPKLFFSTSGRYEFCIVARIVLKLTSVGFGTKKQPVRAGVRSNKFQLYNNSISLLEHFFT